jgi:enoyl-CoA hydratase/carnithine racemase
MSAPVTIARADGTATVTVDSPPVNAMGRAVIDALAAAAEELAGDADTRAVVLTGAGAHAFMAGADITEFDQLLAGRAEALDEFLDAAAATIAGWATLPQPVIAAAHANAIGGGLEMALACDLIVLDPGARVGLPEVKLGLIPGGGGTQRLTRRIGAAAAKRMMMLGTLLDAEQALACGIVDAVAPAGAALDTAARLAARLAANPAVAVQAIKHAVDAAEADRLSDGLAAERTAFLEAFRSNDFQEGYTAFLEKRKPVFSHR